MEAAGTPHAGKRWVMMGEKTFAVAALIGLALGHDAMADDRAKHTAAMGSTFARAGPHHITTRPAPRCWLLLVLHRSEQPHARLLGSVSRTVRCGRLLWARSAGRNRAADCG